MHKKYNKQTNGRYEPNSYNYYLFNYKSEFHGVKYK